MRPIKYKCLGTPGWKPTENKGWFYGSNILDEYLGPNKKENHFNLAYFEKHIQGNYFDKNTRCIYIDQKDKFNNEIYEGDICLFADWKPKVIAWRNGRYWLGDTDVICCNFECAKMQVIGNIHS